MVYPTYLDDADDTVKEYYEAWAAQYGPDTASAYETEFLLGVAPVENTFFINELIPQQ